MGRPEYPLEITINEQKISRVIIDQHYREKHTDLDDEMILEMVRSLNGESFPIETAQGDYEYFRVQRR